MDAPKAGEYLDTTAVVKADENITWEIPVFWLGTHDAVSGDSRGEYTVSVSESDGQIRKIRVSYIETEGTDAVKAEKDGYYIPVLSFFLPLVYSCVGKVELDKHLSDLFEATGGVMTIENPADGITYITGMIGGLKKFPIGTESEQTVPETASDRVAPSGNEEPGTAADAVLNFAENKEGEDLTEDIGTENDDEPGEKTDDESGNEPNNDPKDEDPTEDPTEEPAEPEKTKYELFADSYYRDTKFADYRDDYMLYPDWFAEGTAQLICGFYQDSFTADLFNKIRIKENDGVAYTKERIKAQYTKEIRTLDPGTYSQDIDYGTYCYGPLAVMYLLDRHLLSSGKPSALKYDGDGTLTYVDVTELRDSMSDVLLLLHSEKTLDEIIQDTLGEDCDTFEDMFIGLKTCSSAAKKQEIHPWISARMY